MPEGASIADSSCLIALAGIGRLDLLRQLYGGIVIPEAVFEECGSKLPSWCEVRHVQNRSFVQLLQLNLGPGESEAIALACECSVQRLILDDRKARQAAQKLNLPVTGLLAVLLKCKSLGFVASVGAVIKELAVVSFYASPALIEATLRMAGESDSSDAPN